MRKKKSKTMKDRVKSTTLDAVPERVKHMSCKVMDYKDEQMVVSDLEGRSEYLDKLVYHFPQAGKDLYGFSWEGAKQMAIGRGHIQIWKPDLIFTEFSVIASVNVVDLKRNINFYGSAEQMRFMSKTDGSKIADKFAVPKAVNKAMRNGILNCIPFAVKQKALDDWKKIKRNVLTLKETDVPADLVMKDINRRNKSDYNAKQVVIGPKPEQLPKGPGTQQVTQTANATVTKPVYGKQGQLFIGQYEKCTGCGYECGSRMVEISNKKYGKTLCIQCQRKEARQKGEII